VPGDYVRISSGLGASSPLNIVVLPVIFEGSVRAVVELASFSAFSPTHLSFLDQITESIGLVLNTIEADMLTDDLLKQSQSLAEELRAQQEELRASNQDLGRQASLLAEQNIESEQKNQEIEASKRLVEEKAGQLSVSSRYKSEFIANMSHELRTPLNSLLILAEQLEENPDGNMTDVQVQYAAVIRASGNDLLALLNGILDLAKVESGTSVVHLEDLSVAGLGGALLQEFEPVASAKGLDYTVRLTPECPEDIVTDPQRLRQILKNLLVNAFKFTDEGRVQVDVDLATGGWSPACATLEEAPSVVAFSVLDTGIGIARSSSAGSSSSSHRPRAPPPGSTAAPGSACRSAATSPTCSAVRSPSSAPRASAAPSPSTSRWLHPDDVRPPNPRRSPPGQEPSRPATASRSRWPPGQGRARRRARSRVRWRAGRCWWSTTTSGTPSPSPRSSSATAPPSSSRRADLQRSRCSPRRLTSTSC
jgi:signal transduction histidine kinase